MIRIMFLYSYADFVLSNVRTDVYEIQCPYKQPFTHNIAVEFVQAFIKLDQLATLHSVSVNV